MNKKLLGIVISLVLVVSLFVGGTIAYLTDRDSEANVFTVGNVSIDLTEDFEQGAQLVPGVDINKDVQIENTGINDAWVWVEIAIPAALDAVNDASKNIVHFNYDADHVNDTEWIWQDAEGWMVDTDTINDIEYNVYTVMYQTALKPTDVTSSAMTKVYMDRHIDIDPDGNWYWVDGGTATSVNWNSDVTPIMYVSAYAIQAAGFDTVQEAYAAYNEQWGENGTEYGTPAEPTGVSTAAELQAALDAAEDGAIIVLNADIAGDVTVTQKPGVKITINGNGHEFAGVILVDGKSGTYTTAGLTIANVNFKADSISADACIQLGNGTNATRYTCNVTVSGCTFDVPGAVGVKSYTGGDKNLTITGCTATANAHSLAQLKGIDGVLVENCTVNSVRGINLNNSDNVTVSNCNIDVQKYAVRFGESANTTVENYEIIDSTIVSDNEDGDAAIVLRAGATNANLTITNTTITAETQMSGNESANVVIK